MAILRGIHLEAIRTCQHHTPNTDAAIMAPEKTSENANMLCLSPDATCNLMQPRSFSPAYNDFIKSSAISEVALHPAS